MTRTTPINTWNGYSATSEDGVVPTLDNEVQTITTSTTIGAGLKSFAAALVGAGATFTTGAGTFNGNSVPLGTTIRDSGENGQTLENNYTFVATGGAYWLVTKHV